MILFGAPSLSDVLIIKNSYFVAACDADCASASVMGRYITATKQDEEYWVWSICMSVIDGLEHLQCSS